MASGGQKNTKSGKSTNKSTQNNLYKNGKKQAKKVAKKVAKKHPVLAVVIVLLLIALAIGGYFVYTKYIAPKLQEGKENHNALEVSGDLSIHFLELGNYFTGDCTLIKTGDTEILIDAGSTTSSIETVDGYIKNYCTDGKLEYVIVTHAHEDHYACFTTENSLFNRYEIGVIIDFAQTNQKEITEKGNLSMYGKYKRELQEAVNAGATHYTAKEVRESGNYTFTLTESITFTVLDSYFYYNKDSSGDKKENNHSVCTLLTHGERNFLFTGDLEKEGEEKLVDLNELPEVELFKAGHHGSKTSSNDCLLSVIKPKRVCVCCCAGSSEYTKEENNKFPTQEFIDRVAPYTDKVYVTTLCLSDGDKSYTSMNGNIVVISSKESIRVACSNNDTLLKDTDWFKNKRVLPEKWKQ